MTDQFAMHKENLIKNSNINQKKIQNSSIIIQQKEGGEHINDKDINYSMNSDEIEAEIYAHIGSGTNNNIYGYNQASRTI